MDCNGDQSPRLCLLEGWRRARLLLKFTAFPPPAPWSPTFPSFWKEWVLFHCTWYLLSITQLLYLQDHELQTRLFKCSMCTSEVLSWHFLLFSFPSVHSYAFLFHLQQLLSTRGPAMEANTTSRHFSRTAFNWSHRATSEKFAVGLKACGGLQTGDGNMKKLYPAEFKTSGWKTNPACTIPLLRQENLRPTLI